MRSTIAVVAVLALASCGGGGGDGKPASMTQQPVRPAPVQAHIDFPLLSGGIAYAGIHQSVSGDYPTESLLDELPEAGQRGQTVIRYGTLQDGAGRSLAQAYLEDVALHGDAVSRFRSAPAVRIVSGASERERRIVEEAVEAINLSLPVQFQIQYGPDVPDTDAYEDGTIDVRFLSCAEFGRCGSAAASTFVSVSSNAAGEQTARSADVLFARGTFSYSRDDQAPTLMAHELLHAMGIDHHVRSWLSSIMQASDHYRFATPTILTALDREALAALYRRLKPGDAPSAFGPWEASSLHIAGNGEHANFGVALRNGYTEPWAHGRLPDTDLATNRSLSGNAAWTGELLGLTPDAAAVAGDARIGVDLASMTGSADFTGLETWGANMPPGEEGTGATWLDGDLRYAIAVRGNTFRETGGDAGRLSGIFVGRSHEAVAGTLERSDLTAAFGASR